jgi:EAL domain-containing protein (putative c-di-GMP-specific phosphodiesterase class I)
MTMDTNPENAVIVQSTIDLGHKFGLIVVAEGVESEIQRNMLKKMGCDVVQGYWLSRPLAADCVEAWIQGSNFQAKVTKGNERDLTESMAIPA